MVNVKLDQTMRIITRSGHSTVVHNELGKKHNERTANHHFRAFIFSQIFRTVLHKVITENLE